LNPPGGAYLLGAGAGEIGTPDGAEGESGTPGEIIGGTAVGPGIAPGAGAE